MPKAAVNADQLERTRLACATLGQLQDETWRLYTSITAEARRAHAAAAAAAEAARAQTKAKAVSRKRRRATASE